MQIIIQKYCRILVKNYVHSVRLNNHKTEIKQWKPFLLKYQQICTQCILRMNEKNNEEKNAVVKRDSLDYILNRVKELQILESTGINIHFNKFDISHSLTSVIKEHPNLKPGEETSTLVSVRGKVNNFRNMGTKLVFYDIVENESKLQLKFNKRTFQIKENFINLKNFIKIGDQIGVKGYVIKTKAGELSVLVTELQIIAPQIAWLPDKLDQANKITYMDLLKHKESREIFVKRMDIINYIKRFLKDKGYLEVKTPILTNSPSGAIAKPFKTYSNSLQENLFFRIAPELYLKMLIVGNIPKVFEIGPQFRNEMADKTHFPCFRTCEFYAAHSDYNDLIRLTEEMLSQLVYKLFGTFKIKYPLVNGYEINFEPPFKRVDVTSALENILGVKLPSPTVLGSRRDFFVNICNTNTIDFQPEASVNKLIDKLCDKFLISDFTNPTFLINHPLIMSPLAKAHRDIPGLSERFELYVANLELCDAYTELNDPAEQEARFNSQIEEGVISDEYFIHALRHGLPPTAGWGMGIDRLVMILTNSQSINQVIPFPHLKSASKSYPSNIIHKQAPPLQREAVLTNNIRCVAKIKTESISMASSKHYYIRREIDKETLRKNGFNLYPHKFDSSHSLDEVINNHSNLLPGEVTSNIVSVTGRISFIKKTTCKLNKCVYLCNIFNDETELQLVLSEEQYSNKIEFTLLSSFLARGDHLGAKGHVMMTYTGELAVRVTDLKILSPCLVPLPITADGSNENYIELMLMKETRQKFIMIANIKDYLGQFLKGSGFLEIETPLLVSGETLTKDAFETFIGDSNSSVCVCKNPELYMIQALVGGLNKVWEIRTQFRNICPDSTTYPEFTTCQFFMVHSDYKDVIGITEALLAEVVFKLFGSYKIKYQYTSSEFKEINFEPPFKTLDVMSVLQSKLQTKLPNPSDLDSNTSRDLFFDICTKNNIVAEPGMPVGKLINLLCRKMLVNDLTNPTFLINHPLVTSPFAKALPDFPGLTERVELFVANMELGNAYTVINDPREQDARYRSKIALDNGIVPDEAYIHALRFGLPSTAGISMGVDRLAMILGNCRNIKEVILFPNLGSPS